jgi:phasin family protein
MAAATPAQFVEFHKGNVDTLYALSHALFGATEKLVDLNLAAAKALMDESAETSQAYLGVKDIQELLALNASFAQPTLQKFASYSRNVYSIASGTSAEIQKIMEVRIADGNRKVAELVDFAAKNAPAGSESAVSLIKNAVAASNTAYDTIAKAAKQAVDAAESNFAAAAEATINAASAANDVARGSSKKAA